MSREQIEHAYSSTIEKILEVVGQSMAVHIGLLGDSAVDIAVNNVEEYLKLLKGLREEYERPPTVSHHSCMSPLLNDSMLIHRNRLARSSKSKLNMLRNSPEPIVLDGSPMEVDRGSLSFTRIAAITEEVSLLDATGEMDDTTNERGFLADVSDMNGTVRSRMPSFNFDQISPVSCGRTRRSIQLLPINGSIDFDADTSTLTINSQPDRSYAGREDSNSTILVNDDEMRTPRPRRVFDPNETPTNLWNVKLRPGSNRKISEEIRRQIQLQLAIDEENEERSAVNEHLL